MPKHRVQRFNARCRCSEQQQPHARAAAEAGAGAEESRQFESYGRGGKEEVKIDVRPEGVWEGDFAE